MNKKCVTDRVFALLKRHVCSILPETSQDQVVLENSLRELGANSMDRADIIISTLASLNLHVPLVLFAQSKTIGELVALMVKEQQTEEQG